LLPGNLGTVARNQHQILANGRTNAGQTQTTVRDINTQGHGTNKRTTEGTAAKTVWIFHDHSLMTASSCGSRA
jgi:hypothetical protein